ncbi:MAG TPA: helix-turn-helix domain-containing protein, partial [Dehalococcoidia bacterium]|nr:helix-turn-helix domain-containing protein [Dehalococcoidia bacterium]
KLGPSPELTQSYCGASRREMLRLTYEEQRRAAVLDDWDRGHTSAAEAATVLGLSPAYVRRLRVKYREKGPRALAHGNRGRRSAHSLDSSVTARVAELARTKYVGLTGKRLAEKLGEEGIKVSRSSVRRILLAFGVETTGWHTRSD